MRVIKSNIFAPQEISLPRGTLLLGSHGSGKTQFLRMLEFAFGRETHSLFPERGKFSHVDGSIVVTLHAGSTLVERELDLSASREERLTAWPEQVRSVVEPWHLSALHAYIEMQLLFQEYELARSMSSQAKYHKYSAGERRTLKNILGRQYDDLIVYRYEYDVPDQIDVPDHVYDVPYVIGTTNGKPIESGSMSFGEIWVHFLLGYALRKVNRQGPLLLDEPEALLAPRGHRALMDEVARLVLARNMQLLVASHSIEVMSRFPLRNIRLCVGQPPEIELITPRSESQIRDVLGLDITPRVIVLVEDGLAAEVFGLILSSQGSSGVSRSIEIVAAGGASEAAKTARILRRPLDGLKRLSCVAVLDGDQKSSVAEEGALYLPGLASPEEELLAAARQHRDMFAQLIGRRYEDVLLAIDACKELDHQYVIDRLARSLEQTRASILKAMVECWLSDEIVKEQAAGLASAIEHLLA